MGNQKSREENNFKLQTRIRHPLPSELLCEITKWIQIKIERRAEKQQNQNKAKSKALDSLPTVNKKSFAFCLQKNKKLSRTRMKQVYPIFLNLYFNFKNFLREDIRNF